MAWLGDALFEHGQVEPGDVPLDLWVEQRWVSPEAATHLAWARKLNAGLLLDYGSAVRWAVRHRPLLLAEVVGRSLHGTWAPPPVPVEQVRSRAHSALRQHAVVKGEAVLDPVDLDVVADLVHGLAMRVAEQRGVRAVETVDLVLAAQEADRRHARVVVVDHRPLLEQASHLLDAAMADAGLTNRTLAERLGVTRQAVMRMRTGANMQIGTLEKYLAACGQRMVVSTAPLGALAAAEVAV